jgi:hypothetical protein
MSGKNWDDEFEQVIHSAGHPVGSEELAAREALGDEQYEKLVALNDRNNFLALKKEEAQINYLTMLTTLYSVLVVAGLAAILFGAAWSFYYWFK